MATSILREEVVRLVDEDQAQVVDVLPAAEFDEQHIAGAISIPLKKLDRESVSVLDRTRPVIVYCHDST